MVEFVKYKSPKGPKMYHFGKYNFSQVEFKHLGIALVYLASIFFLLSTDSIFSRDGIIRFAMIVIILALAFLLHEFAHKFVAQSYGFISEFRSDYQSMIFTFLLALFVAVSGWGFAFLAPGAVLILGRPTLKQNGIISVAGPIVNLIQAMLFSLLLLALSPVGLLKPFLVLGIWINAFLGIFNMLPFWVLDGKKVLKWNKPIYFLVMLSLIAFLILALSYF